MTETDLMQRLARDLGPLALDAQWSTTATSEQPYGSYSDALADAKEGAGIAGDLSAVTSSATLALVRRLALLACLERLELHYATLVDTTTGGDAGEAVTQKLSQVRTAIGQVRATLAAAVATAAAAPTASPTTARGVNLRGRRRPDYDVGGGNVVIPDTR
ncbi:MAG: hypothetical protein IPO81_00015 [Kouleothrix sp.]|nr:hypothetical protein [Kouleothrix sp.]